MSNSCYCLLFRLEQCPACGYGAKIAYNILFRIMFHIITDDLHYSHALLGRWIQLLVGCTLEYETVLRSYAKRTQATLRPSGIEYKIYVTRYCRIESMNGLRVCSRRLFQFSFDALSIWKLESGTLSSQTLRLLQFYRVVTKQSGLVCGLSMLFASTLMLLLLVLTFRPARDGLLVVYSMVCLSIGYYGIMISAHVNRCVSCPQSPRLLLCPSAIF